MMLLAKQCLLRGQGGFNGPRLVTWCVNRDLEVINFIHDGASYDVPLVAHPIRATGGVRWLFQCLACQHNVRRLHLVDDKPVFVCSSCAGLSMRTGKKRLHKREVWTAARAWVRARTKCPPTPPDGRISPAWLKRIAQLNACEDQLMRAFGVELPKELPTPHDTNADANASGD